MNEWWRVLSACLFNRENKNFYPLEIQSVSLIRISNIGGKEGRITRAERLPLLGNWFASLCNLCFSQLLFFFSYSFWSTYISPKITVNIFSLLIPCWCQWAGLGGRKVIICLLLYLRKCVHLLCLHPQLISQLLYPGYCCLICRPCPQHGHTSWEQWAIYTLCI